MHCESFPHQRSVWFKYLGAQFQSRPDGGSIAPVWLTAAQHYLTHTARQRTENATDRRQ